MHLKTLITLATVSTLFLQASAQIKRIKLVGTTDTSKGCFAPGEFGFQLSSDCIAELHIEPDGGLLYKQRSTKFGTRVFPQKVTVANTQPKTLRLSTNGIGAKAVMIPGREGTLLKIGQACFAPRFVETVPASNSGIRIIQVPCTDALLRNQFEFECFFGTIKVPC